MIHNLQCELTLKFAEMEKKYQLKQKQTLVFLMEQNSYTVAHLIKTLNLDL